MLTDGKGEKSVDKRHLNLFGLSDFMTEEFNVVVLCRANLNSINH